MRIPLEATLGLVRLRRLSPDAEELMTVSCDTTVP